MFNCCSSGMHFFSDQYLEPGSQVMISRLTNGKEDGSSAPSTRCEGVVRWCIAETTGGFLTGIQYSDIAE